MINKKDEVPSRFIDYSQELLKARLEAAGPAFFGAAPDSVLPLNPREIPERIDQAVKNLPLNESQKKLLTETVAHWLSLIGNKAHSNQPRELVNFTQQGLSTVPGYRPPDPEKQQKLKK